MEVRPQSLLSALFCLGTQGAYSCTWQQTRVLSRRLGWRETAQHEAQLEARGGRVGRQQSSMGSRFQRGPTPPLSGGGQPFLKIGLPMMVGAGDMFLRCWETLPRQQPDAKQHCPLHPAACSSRHSPPLLLRTPSSLPCHPAPADSPGGRKLWSEGVPVATHRHARRKDPQGAVERSLTSTNSTSIQSVPHRLFFPSPCPTPQLSAEEIEELTKTKKRQSAGFDLEMELRVSTLLSLPPSSSVLSAHSNPISPSLKANERATRHQQLGAEAAAAAGREHQGLVVG